MNTINIEHAQRYGFPMVFVAITAIVDNVEIKNVSVNKGHCKFLENYSFSKKLQFSEKMKLMISTRCDVMQIDVETNQGDWSVAY